MANINLEVSAGQSKAITFQSAGKFTTEDIVFNVTGAAGSTTIAAGASGDTNQLTLSANTKYKLTSAGSTFVFTTPPDHTYNFSGVSFTSTNSTASDKNANNLTGNGTYYYASNGPSTDLGASTADGALYVQAYNTSWVGQIAQDYRNGRLFVRGKNNGTWSAWKRIANYDEVATSGHNHDSVYKKKQTAVTDPATSVDTAGAFVDSITQNEQGVITATKKSLPKASSSAAGITKVGASGGAAAYSHSHSISLSATGTSTVDLAASTTYTLTAGGGSVAFKTPAGYTHPTTAGNKHIPSGGSSGQFLAYGGSSGTATWVSNPNTDSSVLQKVDTASKSLWRPILLGFNDVEDTTMFSDVTKNVWSNQKIGFNVSKGFIKVSGGYVVDGQSGFLKADGGIDSNTYALSNHTHSYAASSHSHGSITSDGKISSGTALANGDAIVFSDSSDGSKLKKSTIAFDGSTTTKFLSQKGTWETPSGGGGASIASPAAVSGTLGTVMPIDNFKGDVSFSPQTYNTSVTALYSDNINFALPIGMDRQGRLFLPITDEFMAFLGEMGYKGGKGEK